MDTANDYDVVIIGGGLVGAAAAVGLARQGRSVALLEIRPPHTDAAALQQGWDARIYALSPANRQLLESWQAWPDHSRVQPVLRMDVRGDAGGRICFDAAAAGVPRLSSIVENRWLLAALWRQIRALGVTVVTDAAADLETDVHHVRLRLQDGRRLQARLLVGADGAHSWVRRQAGIDSRDRAYGHHGVVANFHCEHDHRGTAFQWFKQGEVLAYLPLPQQQISIVWSTATPARLTSLDAEALAAAVTRQGEGVLGRLSPLSPAHAFELVLRQPQQTVAQRLLLIGDAAHTVHPLAGQGVNLGFGDVDCLVGLAAGADDIGAWPVLRQYQQQRLGPVRTMQQACDGLFRLFGAHSLPALPWLRNTGLSLVNRAGWLKRQLMREAMGM